MSISSDVTLIAGLQAVGIDGALNVLGSNGVVVSTFARSSAGRYSIQLVENIFPSACVVTCCALDVGSVPLICHASLAPLNDEITAIGIRMDANDGTPTDGANIMVAVQRFLTDG